MKARRRRSSSEDRILVQAAQLLAEAPDTRHTLEAVAHMVVPRLGDHCVVDLVDEAGRLVRLAAVAADPEKQLLLDELGRRYPPSRQPESPAYRALRTGKPVIVESFGEEGLAELSADEEFKDLVRRMRPQSTASVPIRTRERVVGIITFGMAESGRSYAPGDIDFVDRLARQAGLAIENARLYDAERVARHEAEQTAARLARLERLTKALAEATSPAQVALAVLRHALPALDANAGLVVLRDPESQTLVLLASEGLTPTERDAYAGVSLDRALPTAAAVRTGQPVLVADRAIIAIPLVVHSREIGALAFHLKAPELPAKSDRDLLMAVADQCAQALERARLREAEGRAREAMEAAHVRLLLLADAQEQFVEAAHDYQRVLATVARRLAEVIGDMCFVRILSDDRTHLLTPAVYHPDARVAEAIHEVLQQPQPADTGLSGQVLGSGRALRIPQTDPSQLAQQVAPQFQAQVPAYPIYSAMAAPLRGRGETFGLLQMARIRPGRPYDESDLVLLEQLAQRAGMAIAKARLFKGERAARAEAERAVQARDELLATVSHDLRTPLGTIGMAAHLLQETLDRRGEHPSEIGAILRGVGTMDHLIEDLVGRTRLEGNRIQLELGDHQVRDVFGDVLELLRPHVEEKGLRLNEDIDLNEPTVRCDRKRIVQVLANLTNNAIKVTREGGTVTLMARSRDRQVEITVRDTGPGLTPETRERMFEPYWTTDGGGGPRESLGLGLAIVRGLLEAHGSSLQVASDPQTGKVFSFLLPAPVSRGQSTGLAE